MGAWGTGSFENDDAGDWAWELSAAVDTSILKEAFLQVIETEYLDAPDCSIGIAAAEVVAALRNQAVSELPAEVSAFVRRIKETPSADLISLALRALERIRTKSELQELWDEGDDAGKWQQAIGDLEGRLG